MRIAHGLFSLALLAAGLPADAAIYRCTGTAGEPAFSGQPCADDAATVRLPPTGSQSESSGLRPAERAWLRARERHKRNRAGRRAEGQALQRRRAADAAKAERQAYRCLRKRRALDAVKARLRRGYKPSQGERLRRQRRAHADYLGQFCS